MTQSTQANILRINDAKIAELTLDSTGGLTYGSFVDVPNIREVGIGEKSESFENFADDYLEDVETLMHGYTFSIQNSKVSLDAMAILEGGTVSTEGTTPNQITTYKRDKSDSRPYFKLEAKSLAKNGAGDVVDNHVILYKCKLTELNYTLGKEYAVISCSGIAIPTINNGDIKDIKYYETDTAIS